MSDEQDSVSDLPMGELREITLRIPGECFFCETINLPTSPPIKNESKSNASISPWDDYLEDLLNETEFSPYPADQLAWGYHLCEESKKAFLFATPLGKLRQMGWQNLELFRRVFPSFISLIGKRYDEPTAIFLQVDESLTLACFGAGSMVPEFLYSRAIESEETDGLGKAKSKLLGLVDLSKFELCPDVLVGGEVFRREDNTFEFEHQWLVGKDPALELEQDVYVDADFLWQHDLRSLDFKIAEKTRRRQERTRWKSIKLSLVFAILIVFGLIGVKVGDFQLEKINQSEQIKRTQVPLVLESQKLLEKLKQNQLGGIDPFGAIGRMASFRGGGVDNPHVWFSRAHFETRNHVKIEGEGRNVESVNNFIERLETNQVALVRRDRSGDELRDIKSGGGSTTFDVEFDMLEETKSVQPNAQAEMADNQTFSK